MSISAVSPPQVVQPFAMYWPMPTNASKVGNAFEQNGYVWGGSVITGLWDAPVGGATKNMGTYHNLYGGQFTSTAIANSSCTMGTPALVPLTKNAMAAATQQPTEGSVFRWRFFLAQVAAVNYTSLSGVALMPRAGTSPGIPGVNPGFGIFGNGAGGWQWMTSKGGGFIAGDTTALVWPAAVTEWVMVDFEILGATGAQDAQFNLYLNGAKVALPATSSSWAAGTNLPDYSVTANSCGFCLGIYCTDALVGQLNIAEVSLSFGRYRAQSGSQVGTLL